MNTTQQKRAQLRDFEARAFPEIRVGATVHVRAAWCDQPWEASVDYVVVERDIERLVISPKVWPYKIVPQQSVSIYMVVAA